MSFKTQATKLFEDEGLSPAAIAAALTLPVEIVEADLAKHSQVYRESLIAKADEHISDQELRGAYARMKALAAQNEDPRLAFQATVFLINDRRGRLDKKEAGTTINIFQKIQQDRSNAQKRIEQEITVS